MKLSLVVLLAIFSLPAFARLSTVDDIKDFTTRLAPGKYMGKNPFAEAGSDACSVEVRADATHYRVDADPSWSSVGEPKKPLFASVVNGPLFCHSANGAVYCNTNFLESGILMELTFTKTANGVLEVSTSYSDNNGSTSAKCNLVLEKRAL